MTPQQSDRFNDYWEVLDVVHQELEPSDIFEFKVQRKFSSMRSVRRLIEVFQPGNLTRHLEGDIELIICARGSPGIFVYDPKADKPASHPL